VAFVLFGQARLVTKYADKRSCLEGRSMFVATADAGKPYAAILSVDDPVARQADIVHAVQDHLLVRTRADSGLVRDLRRRNAAIESGAHFIGSDFVDPRDGWLDIGPDAPARENPITSVHGQSRRVAEVERSVAPHALLLRSPAEPRPYDRSRAAPPPHGAGSLQ
jgi:Phosphoinositide phospholipase C, Ca2+-dependent